MTLPSKELLNAVFGTKVENIYEINAENDLYFNGGTEPVYPYYLIDSIAINIYELAYKVKEVARSKGYTMESRITQTNKGACKVKTSRELTEKYADTEPEAIFQAYEWILTQQDKEI